MFDENKLRFQIIPGDKEIVTSLERLKYASFDALNDEITVSLGEFLERNMTGLMALYENEIVAGCFACNHAPILYISSLFVKKEYQRCGYHLGKRIFLKTLQQKAEFEKHYKEHFEIAIKKENDSQYTKMATSYKGENLYINEEPVFLLRKSYKEPDMPEFANIETRKVSVQEELNPVLIKLEQLLLKQKLYSLSRFYQQFSILKTHIYGYSCDKAVKCGHEDGYLHLVLANDEDPKTVYHYYQNQGLILHENRFFPADPGILINEEDVKNFPLMKKHAKNEILLPTNLKKRF